MSKVLNVNNTNFNYPEPGEDVGWGEGATGWAEAVTEVLTTVIGPGDIIQTNYPLVNNQASFIPVVGFIFNNATVKAVTCTYRIFRTDGTVDLSEQGEIKFIYKPETSNWFMTREYVGDNSGVNLDITSGGQVQYTTTNFVGQTQAFIRFETVSTIT